MHRRLKVVLESWPELKKSPFSTFLKSRITQPDQDSHKKRDFIVKNTKILMMVNLITSIGLIIVDVMTSQKLQIESTVGLSQIFLKLHQKE